MHLLPAHIMHGYELLTRHLAQVANLLTHECSMVYSKYLCDDIG